MSRNLTTMKCSDEVVSLIEQWCNGEAGAEEVSRLEEGLMGDVEARRYYRRYMNLHAALHQRCEGDEGLDLAPARPVARLGWAGWGGWAVAAALVLMFALWSIFGQTEPSVAGSQAVAGVDPGQTIGLMVSQSGARFAGVENGVPIRFERGEYELEAGIVHLRFTNGVDVVMRGPTRFGIRDAMHMTLEHGVVRAIVPESGQGFTIVAPEMLFEDLGTEFGLAVAEGKSEMHVFNGRVNARKHGEGETVSSVFRGESLRQNGGEVKIDRAGTDVRFPSPEDVGYEGWKKLQPSTLAPQGLIAYFPFDHDSDHPSVLRNVIGKTEGGQLVGDGVIKGARWVTGRWSEKDALLFDRKGDRVELDIPGEFDEISLSTWINIDRLDFAVNTIFASDGWSAGDLHWQVLRTQDPLLAVHEIHECGSLLARPIRIGRWIHLVAVLSKDSGRTRFYVDGQLAQENQLPVDIVIAPGKALIGDWVQESYDPYPKRSLRAKIDEFSIWNRALSEEEIIEMTHAGAPSMLTLAERLVPVKRQSSGAMFFTSKRQAGK